MLVEKKLKSENFEFDANFDYLLASYLSKVIQLHFSLVSSFSNNKDFPENVYKVLGMVLSGMISHTVVSQ
jgi:hypothetical protein